MPSATITDVLDVSEAIREILNGNYTPTVNKRLRAQEQVRDIAEDRVVVGRRVQGLTGPTISLAKATVDPDPDLEDAGDCETTTIEVTVYANNNRTMQVLSRAVMTLLSSIGYIKVVTQDGSLAIGNIWLVEHGEDTPDDPIDASDVWQFRYVISFGCSHGLAPV